MNLYEELGVTPVLNAAGPVTRYGGSVLSERVLAAMAEATRSFVRLDELQLAAGRKLAEWTGAEAGYVTTGAAAGLTLGAAAILAGSDVVRMEKLPDTSGMPNRFILQRVHLSDYDCAIRASGARLLPIDCEEDWPPERVAEEVGKAAREGACGAVYVFRTGDRGMPLEVWVQACHRFGLPVLVDASVRLPPVDNLRRIPGSGADLVAFSGGKAIQGPQNTGFLVGRRDLIESVLLQSQDMDVNAETWFLRKWIEEGRISRPPMNGIGRGFKVSKEGVIGLLVALEEYLARDHKADLMAWRRRVDEVCLGLRDLQACRVERAMQPGGSYPVPAAVLRLTEKSRLTLSEFVNACARLPRPVVFEEGTLRNRFLVIHPMCLSDEDARALVKSVREVLKGSE